jgi:sulfur-carrier protein
VDVAAPVVQAGRRAPSRADSADVVAPVVEAGRRGPSWADSADVAAPLHIAVTVRYFAAARAAAGAHEEILDLMAPADLEAVVRTAAARHGEKLDRVLARCSFLLDEVATHGPRTAVPDGAVVDVLPPFAGG